MTPDPLPIGQELEGPGVSSSPRLGSWADDFLTLALVLPLLLVFIPGLQDVVSRGFAILRDDLPGWYLGALGVAFSAAFGTKAAGAWSGLSAVLRPGPKP